MEDKAVEDLLIDEEEDADVIDLDDVDLESENAPVWYQEPETGWSQLHLAVYNEDPDKVRQLIEAGAVWNAGTSSLNKNASDTQPFCSVDSMGIVERRRRLLCITNA